MRIDPLAEKYPHNSTYAFSGNRVIDAVELEGLEPVSPRYMWPYTSGYRFYGEYANRGDMWLMKVEGYYVLQYLNNEAEEEYMYWDKKNRIWKEFYPASPVSLKEELDRTAELSFKEFWNMPNQQP
jgi:hypothetical protein